MLKCIFLFLQHLLVNLPLLASYLLLYYGSHLLYVLVLHYRLSVDLLALLEDPLQLHLVNLAHPVL